MLANDKKMRFRTHPIRLPQPSNPQPPTRNMQVRVLLLAAVVLVAGRVVVQAGTSDPSVPVGSLHANPVIVRAGTLPELNWTIAYPQTVIDVIDVTPSGKITPKEDLYVDVRVLGAAYQISTNSWGLVESNVKIASANYSRFFYDRQNNVNPTKIMYTRLVRKGEVINFKSRCHNGSSWRPYYSTETTNQNVAALANGDDPPNYTPAFSQGNIESYLRPYLDTNGRMKIGPLDVIYLFELGQAQINSGFDMQDLVLLVTFRRVQT